jgi:hypothetical protein
MHARAQLEVGLSARFFKLLAKAKKSSAKIDRAILASGGLKKSANDLARDLLDAVYESSFSEISNIQVSPFILSFCSHSSDKYESINGLLSQWRGYGQSSGRFCLVFDTKPLYALLEDEAKKFSYTYCALNPANYATNDNPPDEMFYDFFEACADFAAEAIRGKGHESSALEKSFIPFIRGSTFYKHQGFREECEVRIVVLPEDKKTHATILEKHPGASLLPIKPIFSISTQSKTKRYINLFDHSGSELPIKRVIVGPSPSQDRHADMVGKIFQGGVPVVKSETPFID